MVVDRLHRIPRILGVEEKGVLRRLEGGASMQTFVGGVILNQLGWAAALGLRTGIFGKQADDPDGRFLRAAMDRHGIERSIVLDGSASSTAQLFVDDGGGRAIYMAPGATSETTAEHVERHHAAFIRRGRRLVTEVSQLPLAAALAALRIAREARIPTLLDLDVPPSAAVPELGDEAALRAVLEAADLVKPSKAAARELLGEGSDARALPMARALRERFGAAAVVLTDGEAGCAISADGFEGEIPALRPARVVDTTGAGDAFVGGLLAGLRAGLGWEKAARLANAAGAACVERFGAFPDDAEAARARVLELYGAPLELRPLPQPAGSRATPGAPTGSARENEPGRHAAATAGGIGAAPADEVGRRDPATARSTAARRSGAARGEETRGPLSGPDAACREAETIFDVTLEELGALRRRLRPEPFEAALRLIRGAERAHCRVHATGVGKAASVAQYAAGIFSSIGTPSTFIHATDAVHGGAGQVLPGDVVLVISNSGETAEVRSAVEALRKIGVRVVAVVGDTGSWLARHADVVLDAGVAREGGGLGFAPRASVTAQVLVVAALSAALETDCGLTRSAYNSRHPAGRLGELSAGHDDPDERGDERGRW